MGGFSLVAVIFGAKYSRMDQVKFLEDSLLKFLLGPFLNTLSHLAPSSQVLMYGQLFPTS